MPDRVAIRYKPKIKFYRPPSPSHEAMVKRILSEDALLQSNVKPGKRSNIRWITIRNNDHMNDAGLPGTESTHSRYQPSIVTMEYETRWKDTSRGTHWTYVPSPNENAWRDLSLATYNTKLQELLELTNPGPDDTKKIQSLRALIKQLGVGGEGYLETAYGALGTGCSGIVWNLAAANVPVSVTSTFTTQKNRGQSFRLRRLERPEGQARFEFIIFIGNGNSLYSLTIGEDGNRSIFTHYRNMNQNVRQTLMNQLESLLDNARLTAQDLSRILRWEKDIKQIEHRSRATGTDMPPADAATVASLKKSINDLRDSKRGLTATQQQQKEDLEDQLYLAQEQFSLQENSKSMVGKDLDFTLHFLRSGYVVIQSEDGRKIYENKRLTGGVPEGTEPVYGDGLPPKAFITIRSDGGMWTLVYGNPKHDSIGTIKTQPFEIPYDITEDDVTWIYEGDAGNPGCKIEFRLDMIRPARTGPGGIRIHALWQISINLYTNYNVAPELVGRYTPELTYVEMMIKAAPVNIPTLPEDMEWDSEDPDNMYEFGKSKVLDLQIQDDSNRSRLCSAYIGNGVETANLPVLLAGCACDVTFWDEQLLQDISIMTYGFTVRNPRGDHKKVRLDGSGAIEIEAATGNIPVIEISGCENFLNKEIEQPFCCNNMYVGDVLILLARNAGLPVELTSSIPVGDAENCPRIKKMKPGTFPDAVPEFGTTYWSYMKDIVAKHAPRWEVWSDENGLRLTRVNDRRRVDLAYSDTADIFSSDRLRRMSTEAGGLQLVQDLRDYYTSATFIGAINPLTGFRYTGTAEIPQALDIQFEDSMFYTGVPNHFTAPVDETLKSDADCRAAARQYLGITPLTPNGVTPWTLEYKVDLDSTLKGGDIPTINGMLFVVEETNFAGLSTAESAVGQQMKVVARLAEDRRLPSAP